MNRITDGMLQMLNTMEFVLLAFAAFRLTRLIVFDSITEFIRNPFHETVEEEQEDGTVETYIEIKGSGLRAFIGELLSCYWCTGVWTSAFLLLGYFLLPVPFEVIVLIFAIAGASSFIETLVGKWLD